MLLWQQQNPVNLWNPLTWDMERMSDIATTGTLEVLSNIGVGAATAGLGVIPYNAARIIGSEFSEDLKAIQERTGLSPDDSIQTAFTTSTLSTLLQLPLEYLGYRHVKRLLGNKLFNKARNSANKKISTRLNKDMAEWRKKNPKTPLNLFIANQTDNLKAAFKEGATEYTQFMADRLVDKFGYDNSINLLEEAISQEAAADFLSGMFGTWGVTTGADVYNTITAVRDAAIYRGITMDDAFEGIRSIWKDHVRHNAPNQETEEYANKAIDMLVDGGKDQTETGLKISEGFKAAVEKETQRRSDDAIIIESVTNKDDAKLSVAEAARLAEMQEEVLSEHPDAEMDELDNLMQLAYIGSVMNQEAVEETNVTPEQIANTIQEMADNIPDDKLAAALDIYTPEEEIPYEVEEVTPDDQGLDDPLYTDLPDAPPSDEDVVQPSYTDLDDISPDDIQLPDEDQPTPLTDEELYGSPEEGMIDPAAILDAERESLIAQGAPDIMKPEEQSIKKAKETIAKWNKINEKTLEDAYFSDIKKWLKGEKFVGENVEERKWILKQLEYGGDQNILDQTNMKPDVLKALKEVAEELILPKNRLLIQEI